MSVPAELRATHQRALGDLRTLSLAELGRLWRLLDIGNVPGTRDALIELLPAVGEKYGSMAGAVGADYYDAARDAAGARGRFTAQPAPLPTPARWEALARWGVDPLLGADPDAAAALARISGGLVRSVLDGARDTVTDNAVRDPAAYGWQRVTRADGCSFCRMLSSRGAVFRDSTVRFASHDNCFPTGVLVTGPSVEIGYRRWYEGELVIVETSEGDELPVTPNHPILTPRGWVEAGRLNVGDDVIARAGADLATLDVPHEDDVPAPIEDIWGAARMDLLRSMPVSPEDFHGDVGRLDSNVDVVTPYGLLSNVRDIALGEHLAHPIGTRAPATSVLSSLSTHGDSALPFVVAAAGSDGSMSTLHHGASLGRCLSMEPQTVGFARRSGGHIGVREPTRYHRAGDAVTGGHPEDALPRFVDLAQVFRRRESSRRRPLAAGPRFDPPPAQGEAERFRVMGEFGRDLTERLAGGIEVRRVSEIRRVEFAGHVFNLQTTEGWYAANSLVVSNCLCSVEPAFQAGPKLSVMQYTASQRTPTEADRARVRDWISAHPEI